MRREAQILKHGQRGESPARFRRIRAQHSRAVACDVHARAELRPSVSTCGQPLRVSRIEVEFASRQVGELGFGAQVITQRHRVALDALVPGRAHPGTTRPRTPVSGAPSISQRLDAPIYMYAARRSATPAPRLDSNTEGRASNLAERRDAPRLRRGVQHRGDVGAGLDVLRSDEIQQRRRCP